MATKGNNKADGATDKSDAKAVPMDQVWQDNGPERLTNEESLVVDVDGFEKAKGCVDHELRGAGGRLEINKEPPHQLINQR